MLNNDKISMREAVEELDELIQALSIELENRQKSSDNISNIQDEPIYEEIDEHHDESIEERIPEESPPPPPKDEEPIYAQIIPKSQRGKDSLQEDRYGYLEIKPVSPKEYMELLPISERVSAAKDGLENLQPIRESVAKINQGERVETILQDHKKLKNNFHSLLDNKATSTSKIFKNPFILALALVVGVPTAVLGLPIAIAGAIVLGTKDGLHKALHAVQIHSQEISLYFEGRATQQRIVVEDIIINSSEKAIIRNDDFLKSMVEPDKYKVFDSEMKSFVRQIENATKNDINSISQSWKNSEMDRIVGSVTENITKMAKSSIADDSQVIKKQLTQNLNNMLRIDKHTGMKDLLLTKESEIKQEKDELKQKGTPKSVLTSVTKGSLNQLGLREKGGGEGFSRG